jgi:endonuclease/exonuclease/phosphatase family metal-dependent hydrolase
MIKIITCNVRFYGGDDKKNHWKHRKSILIEILLSNSPHIICCQELWYEQFIDILPSFSDFEACVMVDGNTNRNPLNTIWYNKNKFTKLSAGGYFLSDKPHVTGSKSWGSFYPRYVNWVRLELLGTNRDFRIINTHLDHGSQVARENQARLINEDACAYPNSYPQVLVGDMNSDSCNKVIALFKSNGWKDTYESIHKNDNPGHTLHNFQGEDCISDKGKIDWIFIRGDIKIIDAKIIRDSIKGIFPSDHYFVLSEITVP